MHPAQIWHRIKTHQLFLDSRTEMCANRESCNGKYIIEGKGVYEPYFPLLGKSCRDPPLIPTNQNYCFTSYKCLFYHTTVYLHVVHCTTAHRVPIIATYHWYYIVNIDTQEADSLIVYRQLSVIPGTLVSLLPYAYFCHSSDHQVPTKDMINWGLQL